MTTNADQINVSFGISKDIYEYYKIKASRNGTDIDTQLILTLIGNMQSEQFTKELPSNKK